MTRRKVDNPKRVLSVSVKAIIYNVLKKKAEANGTTISRIVEPILENAITNFFDASSIDGGAYSEMQDAQPSHSVDPALSPNHAEAERILKEAKKDVEEDSTD